MLNFFLELLMFSAKATILVLLILALFLGLVVILSRGKAKLKGHITIKNINKKYQEIKGGLLQEVLSKDKYKLFLKGEKKALKSKNKTDKLLRNVFLINFHGDIKASAVSSLREEITAILNIATSDDEVVVCVESGGGMVHAYGLAASQLMRIRKRNIPLTVIVDKVAASGGYLMACVANKILAAPFAIIGSIGVIVQLPNFHRLLKEKHVDFEQITAGSFKRTLTLFGPNTEEGKEKMRQEVDEIHRLFKNLIVEHRPQLDIEKVATGEHWLGSQALALHLVDDLTTSDDYLLTQSIDRQVFEVKYHIKKSLGERMAASAQMLKKNIAELSQDSFFY